MCSEVCLAGDVTNFSILLPIRSVKKDLWERGYSRIDVDLKNSEPVEANTKVSLIKFLY